MIKELFVEAVKMIIFLDFDGVMHPYGCHSSRLFCRRELFEKFLDNHPSIEVVISSAWRKDETLQELTLNFSETARARFVGVTGADQSNSLGRRQRECIKWMLDNNRHCELWIALDDDTDNFRTPPKNGSVIFIDPSEGITDRVIMEMEKLMITRDKLIVHAYDKH